mmetsp:Transcript_41184/g.96225  ORF Transcript_41184/g.96225 Transcript_41184/m.96225 type:complete len:329 (+) Transcript_41184:909-1895(+)
MSLVLFSPRNRLATSTPKQQALLPKPFASVVSPRSTSPPRPTSEPTPTPRGRTRYVVPAPGDRSCSECLPTNPTNKLPASPRRPGSTSCSSLAVREWTPQNTSPTSLSLRPSTSARRTPLSHSTRRWSAVDPPWHCWIPRTSQPWEARARPLTGRSPSRPRPSSPSSWRGGSCRATLDRLWRRLLRSELTFPAVLRQTESRTSPRSPTSSATPRRARSKDKPSHALPIMCSITLVQSFSRYLPQRELVTRGGACAVFGSCGCCARPNGVRPLNPNPPTRPECSLLGAPKGAQCLFSASWPRAFVPKSDPARRSSLWSSSEVTYSSDES